MAEHVWSVVCRSASIDRDSNVVSLLSVVEALKISGGPAKLKELEEAQAATRKGEEVLIPLSDFVLISWFLRSDHDKPEKAKCRLSIDPPQGTLPQKFERHVDLGEHAGVRIRSTYTALPFKGLGTYWFVVELQKNDRWTKVARIPVTLEPSTTPKQPS